MISNVDRSCEKKILVLKYWKRIHWREQNLERQSRKQKQKEPPRNTKTNQPKFKFKRLAATKNIFKFLPFTLKH